MFTSTEGQTYIEFDGELFPILGYSDTSTEGCQLVYVKIPFLVRLFMAMRIAINYIKLAMKNYSVDIADEANT